MLVFWLEIEKIIIFTLCVFKAMVGGFVFWVFEQWIDDLIFLIFIFIFDH